MSQDPRAHALQALSRFLIAGSSLGETLDRIAAITVDGIGGAEVAGISMQDERGQPGTRVYTDETSPEVDEAQYTSDRGPCLSAWRERRVVRLDDVGASDDYPEFAEAAKAHGIRSTISFPLVAGEASYGALNLYARTEAAFDDEDESLGTDLAAAGAVVLVNTAAYWQVFQLGEQLTEAMRSRAVIEQAKGMLMARSDGLDADGAFELLTKASQRENVKLREIAARIVERRGDGASA